VNLWNRICNRPGEPGAPAVVLETGEVISYEGLLQRAGQAAQLLASAGVGSGDRVALLARNGPWFFDLLLACARIGAVLVPINARLSAGEVAYILDDAEPAMLLVDDSTAQLVNTWGGEVLTVEELSCAGELAIAALQVQANAVLLQMYTSGTTGNPKGAMLTHGNVLAIADAGIRHLGPFEVGGRSLVCLPLFHIAAVDWTLFALVSGGCIVLQTEVRAAAIVDAMHQQGVANTLLVPAVVRMVVEELERQGDSIATLKTLCFGASPMPEELIARARAVFPNAQLRHVYGMTESAGMFTALDPQEITSGRRLLSCGKPLTGELRIADDMGEMLAVGEVGNILYRGPQCMLGYWRNEQASKDALKDGWLHTGDLGRIDSEGFLFVLDRSKDLVKTGGENVYPAEVENVLAAHPDVADVAVVGVPDERWGEIVTAVVVSRGSSVSLEELQQFSRERLAGFKVPRRLYLVANLPRNAAGKVQKHVLRRELAQPPQPQ
jgi:long-chain acyl-CoA synthetase